MAIFGLDGYTAFQLHVAMKLHFTTKSYDIFKTRGRMRCKLETYKKRKDFLSYERIASKFTKVNEYVIYLASNMMYGHQSMIFDSNTGLANYNLYLSRRQNIKQVVEKDLEGLYNRGIKFTDGIAIVRALTQGQICFETVAILNNICNLTEAFDELPQKPYIEPLLIRIDKAIGFVKIPSGVEDYIKTTISSY